MLKPNKRINDPLYGAAFLSDTEFKVMSTPAFLRLNGVKQLGLGALVYPSANYTRFAHSIGVCHLTGLALSSIQKNANIIFDDEEVKITRLAALLHDVGHYPFSHTTEEVVKDLSAEDLLVDDSVVGGGSQSHFFPDHEDLGRYIVEHDEEISSIISDAGLKPEAVFDRLKGKDGSKLNLILSSDLDCDRLDYLRRTSLHAGLPYGGVDVNYLIDNLTMDDDGTPCIRSKAVGPADHFLMSRSYDYAQLPFHKAVVGFEEALKKVLTAMHKDEFLDLRRKSISEQVANGEWPHFDDQRIFEAMRKYGSEIKNDETRANTYRFLRNIFERRAPKLVFSLEYLSDEGEDANDFAATVSSVQTAAEETFDMYGISPGKWFMWNQSFRLMKGKESGQRIRVERLVNGVRTSTELHLDQGTLTSKFHGAVKRHIRVYANLIDEEEPKILRDKMRDVLNDRLTELNIINVNSIDDEVVESL